MSVSMYDGVSYDGIKIGIWLILWGIFLLTLYACHKWIGVDKAVKKEEEEMKDD